MSHPANRAHLAATVLILLATLACGNESDRSVGGTPSTQFSCPSLAIDQSPVPSLSPEEEALVEIVGVSGTEAREILRIQSNRNLDGLQKLLSPGGAAGADGASFSYDPCFHVEVRLTSGDGSDVLDLVERSKFAEFAYLIRFRDIAHTQQDLSAAQDAIGEVVSDATFTDLDIDTDQVIVGLPDPSFDEAAEQEIREAWESGEIDLPPEAFKFEYGVVSN